MSALRSPCTRIPAAAPDLRRDRAASIHPLIGHLLLVGPQLWSSAAAALRLVVLVTMAILLILVLLPAAVGAAGAQAASAI
jgi:hypothetical protein